MQLPQQAKAEKVEKLYKCNLYMHIDLCVSTNRPGLNRENLVLIIILQFNDKKKRNFTCALTDMSGKLPCCVFVYS